MYFNKSRPRLLELIIIPTSSAIIMSQYIKLLTKLSKDVLENRIVSILTMKYNEI